ncbi:MAG: universal stress protein [Solirubrobacteraceae bacterium]
MPAPVIVGFDGSEHGSDALALGRALAETIGTHLLVVIAYTPERLRWAPGTARLLDDGERELIVARTEDALSGLDGAQVRTVDSPSAAGALHAEAESERAQLIVVGSTHRGGAGRLLLGTVTQEVLDATPCAVAVAPAGLASGQPLRFSTIGVGFDDAPPAHDALGVARSLAHCAQAELRLIWAAHLVARTVAIDALQPHYYEEVRAGVEARLEKAAAPIREEMKVSTLVVGGGTVDALVEQSDHLDLMVVGSRGYGPRKRVLLGSISRGVVNGARCPVLVVPKGTSTLEDEERPAETHASSVG